MAAVAGGADLIDVKEPTRGAMGRADDAVIAAVIRNLAGRRPVSAALGELTLNAPPCALPGLRYVKWGLAGCGSNAAWQDILVGKLANAASSACNLVPVAYADWHNAAAPSVEEVCGFARRCGGVVLIDTFEKTFGASLLDYLSLRELTEVCAWCHAEGIQVALAGSLGPRQIHSLKAARADWFGVRGAACVGGQRDAAVSARKVRELADLVHA
jgi:uncharacterized protein (UPF0264 family)